MPCSAVGPKVYPGSLASSIAVSVLCPEYPVSVQLFSLKRWTIIIIFGIVPCPVFILSHGFCVGLK